MLRQLIEERLIAAFAPTYLKVEDDSDQHIGHAGHQSGGRHFSIVISADCFKNRSRVAAHQQVYSLFTAEIPKKIHALQIKII